MDEYQRSLEIEQLIEEIRLIVLQITRRATTRQEAYRWGCRIINIVRNNLMFYFNEYNLK
jgi:hypothetical protein